MQQLQLTQGITQGDLMIEGKWKENGPSATQAADINIQEGAMNTKIKITL